MAFPELAETITVKGQYLGPDGDPARGYILVTLDQSLADKDTNTIYTRKPLRYDLDGNGAVEFDIIKTGATDADPVPLTRNVAVTITENFEGVKKYTWKTVFDTSANDETDIFQLADAAEVTQRPLNQYVLLGTYAADLNAKASVSYVNSTFAPKASPTFTGTVTGVTAAHVGLGNVTNESKTTMFSSPTFTGTVTGVTKAMVGLPYTVASRSSYTLVLGDAFTIINGTGAITIPPNSSVAFPIGTVITVIAVAAVTLTQGSGTTITKPGGSTGNATVAIGNVVDIIKSATNTWYIKGNGVT